MGEVLHAKINKDTVVKKTRKEWEENGTSTRFGLTATSLSRYPPNVHRVCCKVLPRAHDVNKNTEVISV